MSFKMGSLLFEVAFAFFPNGHHPMEIRWKDWFMVLSIRQRIEEAHSGVHGMGRFTVHAHGVPKEKAMRELIEMYGRRIKARGISIEFHPAKLEPDAYVDRLLTKRGNLILLDEGGEQDDSVAFAKRFEHWQLASDGVHFAIGPAEGWPDHLGLANLQRLSLSCMTFPHELATVLLVEQLYRATEIQRGSGYHKA